MKMVGINKVFQVCYTVLDIQLSEMEFSDKIIEHFKILEVYTLHDIIKKLIDDDMQTRLLLGRKTRKELREKLFEKGITLTRDMKLEFHQKIIFQIPIGAN